MIRLGDAQKLVRTACRRLEIEHVPFDQGIGRVLASDIVSAANLPPFDNAAMDGFAVNCGRGSRRVGEALRVGGARMAGDGAAHARADEAWEITTGAPVPHGLDTVVPVEQIEAIERDDAGRATRIRLLTDATLGQHLRRAGEDIAPGAVAMIAGERVTPAHLMVAAGIGLTQWPVVRAPRIALLCTGNELVDDPTAPLAPGMIRNANAPFLAARLRAAGAHVVLRETVRDDTNALLAALARADAAGADMVVSTGAVSMGRLDFVPDALRSLDARSLFHKVAMRPGKPVFAATLADGTLFLGLPGNPVACALGLRFLVEPAVRRCLGLPTESPLRLPLLHGVRKQRGLRYLLKAHLRLRDDGALAVGVLHGQESFKTWPLLRMTAWASLDEDRTELPEGTKVDVFPLGHEQEPRFGEVGAEQSA